MRIPPWEPYTTPASQEGERLLVGEFSVRVITLTDGSIQWLVGRRRTVASGTSPTWQQAKRTALMVALAYLTARETRVAQAIGSQHAYQAWRDTVMTEAAQDAALRLAVARSVAAQSPDGDED